MAQAKATGKKVNSTLGRRPSAGVRKRVSEGLHRARARGKPLGQPRIHPIFDSVCENCERPFRWSRGEYPGMAHQTTGRFCGKRCLVKWLHKYRQILPHADEVKRLYWEEGMSLWEIARKFGVTDQATVKKAMAKAGVARRPKKNIGKKVCIVAGCGKSTYKIMHTNNGSPYGRRCLQHWEEHRDQLAKDYYARKGGARRLQQRIVEALGSEVLTADQLSQRIGETRRTVSNTMKFMRIAGVVERQGFYRPQRRGGPKWVLWKLKNERTVTQSVAA